MSFFWLVLLLPLFICVYYKWGYVPYQVFKKMNIPGPPPLPFLGNLVPFIYRKEGMDIILTEWHEKYGAIYGFYFGIGPALSIADPVLIQKVYITNFKTFSDRSKLALLNTQATGLPPGIFESPMDDWKKIRHIAQPAFSKAKLAKMSLQLERSCSVMVDRMLEESSARQYIDIIELYKDYVLEVAVLVVLGQEVWLQKGEAQEFKWWIELGTSMSHGTHPLSHLYTYLPVELAIGHQFPWFVKFYYWLSLGRFMPSFRKLKTVITDCIQDRREKASKQQLQENCVLNLMVAASVNNDDHQLSEDEMISHCLNFLFAAYDTTSLTLTCASHLLATNPHVQDKLCAMLDDYWSQHEVVEASVSTVAQDVPYLDMVLDETMRLYPPGTRMDRICNESIEVGGISFPKGIQAVIPIFYLHRLESIWGDPEVFRPERFSKEESTGRHSCSFLPMGVGPRNCIGLKLAKLLMKMALVTLLQRHHFVRTQKTEDTIMVYCHHINLALTSKVYIDIQPRN